MEQTLGKRIMAHRKGMGLTQDALAERLGVTAQAVSKWENDQSCPDITMLPRLAEVFGTTTDELLGVAKQEEAKEGEVVEETPQKSKGAHTAKGDFEFKWDSGRHTAVTFAVLILLVGALTLLVRLMDWTASFWDILWPAALVVYGAKLLIMRFTFLRLCVALTGLYYLAANLNDWHFSLGVELLFPIVLLILGAGLLVDALRKPRRPRVFLHYGNNTSKRQRRQHIDGESFECSAAFCEDNQYISLPRLSSGSAGVSFGEMTVDLSGVGEISEDCAIDLGCSFGELTLLVPRRFRVKPNSGTFFSSVTISGEPAEETVGTIHVDAGVSFGEICIRYI